MWIKKFVLVSLLLLLMALPASAEGDWLSTRGNRIVDKNGKQVWITGLNWFGYNTGTNCLDGLWNVNANDALHEIAHRGFNMIRLPFSTELIDKWSKGQYPTANYNQSTNAQFNGLNSLQIFDAIVEICQQNGLKLMIDIHSTSSNSDVSTLWYDSKFSEDDYLSALKWMANRYKSNDTIIAFDLKNEPHGSPPNNSTYAIWNGSESKNNWRYMAERAALAVLSHNPNVLVMVEGVEAYPKNISKNSGYTSKNADDYYFNWWGGNLRGVKDFPVQLGQYQDKLVYSPHDYGPPVYEQPWFQGNFTFDTLMKNCWKDNWFYIHEQQTAPLLIGEWGGFMTERNLQWMTALRRLIVENQLNHTFWCFNSNSGDTGGLVKDDFKTWDEDKYNFLRPALWTENGKFMGLDSDVPLGGDDPGDPSGPSNPYTPLVQQMSITVNGQVQASAALDLSGARTLQLGVTMEPTNASKAVSWTSGNKKIATVNASGLVTAKKAGKVNIQATAKDGSGKTARIAINVARLVRTLSITGKTKLVASTKITLKANARPLTAAQRSVTWSTSDSSVATVSSKGVVTAQNVQASSKVTISAHTKDGSDITASHEIMVLPQAQSVSIMMLGSALPGTLTISLSSGQRTAALSAVILPSDASQTVSWKSSKPLIAKVTAGGKVTALRTGTAVITATAKDGSQKSMRCILTVTK